MVLSFHCFQVLENIQHEVLLDLLTNNKLVPENDESLLVDAPRPSMRETFGGDYLYRDPKTLGKFSLSEASAGHAIVHVYSVLFAIEYVSLLY